MQATTSLWKFIVSSYQLNPDAIKNLSSFQESLQIVKTLSRYYLQQLISDYTEFKKTDTAKLLQSELEVMPITELDNVTETELLQGLVQKAHNIIKILSKDNLTIEESSAATTWINSRAELLSAQQANTSSPTL